MVCRGFNSNLVRLKPKLGGFTSANVAAFQFQSGTIKAASA